MIYSQVSASFKASVVVVDGVNVSRNVQEALKDPKLNVVVHKEMRALIDNDTWNVVNLPENKKTVGCKQVFIVKYKADSDIELYKSGLVAQGFTQAYEIDYEETFDPVLYSCIVIYHSYWELIHLDIKNVFLNAELEEEIYMRMPSRFEDKSNIGGVCKLNKSFYGLKQ